MDSFFSIGNISPIIWKYRVHLFVFFLAFFIGMTFAHPAVLLNDEFITTNQLRQLHAGDQIITNEGKYGLDIGGNMSGYFAYRSNILGYSIFLPLISLPAYWIIDITGEQFAYLIIVLWAVLALALLLFINRFFRKYSYIGRWQWTSVMVVVVFLLFFINLFFYSKFQVDSVESYPEILAIVFTNMFLLALSAVLIYETCRTIFEDPTFSFFGTVVCMSSSSYFLWVTFCKDHILVLPIFAAVFLCLVRFFKTDEYWYLPLAFLLCGTLAWARPELALWTVLLVSGVCGYTLIRFRTQDQPEFCLSSVLCAPLFTLLGALPFFLNNYLITKNVLLPPESLYLTDATTSFAINSSHSLIRIAGVKSAQSMISMFVPTVPSSPVTTLTDLVGIFFYPQNGSISVFAVVSLALVMIILAGVLLILKEIQFSADEKKFVGISILVSGAVFLAYASQIHILNADYGVVPDIRYLSPLYIPLTIIGLLILRKIDIFNVDPTDAIRLISYISLIGIALTIFLLPIGYVGYITTFMRFVPLGNFFSLYAFTIAMLALVSISTFYFLKCGKKICTYLILLLCLVPFFWQVSETLMLFSFSGYAGYIFWIPTVRIVWDFIIYHLVLH